MKKFNLSLVAVLAMSTFAIAGGDIAPVEPVIEEPIVVEEPSVGGFYLGLGYGWSAVIIDHAEFGDNVIDDNFGSIMIDAGYKFNQYVAIEGRYWFGLGSTNDLGWTTGWDNSDVTIDSWGIYVKPMYPVTDSFNIYALLGYGSTQVDVDRGGSKFDIGDADGFSWGLGLDYAFTENISMFLDYTSLVTNANISATYDLPTGGTIEVPLGLDESVGNINIGVNYTF